MKQSLATRWRFLLFPILLLTIILPLGGCESLQSLLKIPPTGEEMYHQLDQLIDQPSLAKDSSLLNQEIVFSALIFSEPFEDTLYIEDGSTEDSMFQYGKIARNNNDLLLLEVSQLAHPPAPGDYVTITGSVIGYVEYEATEEYEASESLEVLVSEIQPLEELEKDISTQDTLSHRDNVITFTHAMVNHQDGWDYLSLCFDYTNHGNMAETPRLEGLELYQNNTFLTIDPDFSVPSPLDGAKNAQEVLANPGETTQFYQSFLPYEGILTPDDVEIVQYDDDFHVVYQYFLPVEDARK